MSISEQTLEILEFPKVREQLTRYTSFSASHALALELLPSTEMHEVKKRLGLTHEARKLFEKHSEITIGGARDIRPLVARAMRGGVLETSDLLEIANTLRSIGLLREALLKVGKATIQLLGEFAEALPQLPKLEAEIAQALDEERSCVRDDASPALKRIRHDVQIAGQRLQEYLQRLISSSEVANALQEAIITVRNGRYVVPVKAAQRRVVRGLVHDQSASGATLYIEPFAAVDLNNRWRELQLAEAHEVLRILTELSGSVGADGITLIAGIETLAQIDLAFAQAKYASQMQCFEPDLIDLTTWQPTETAKYPLFLREARHPLLDQRTVVPIDLFLGHEFYLLLITGPNTGGKTVALKTVGLLALMAQAGCHIPVGEGSCLPLFGQIFADIGDEQSIEQSLSTFSAHLTNIIRILKALDAKEQWENPNPSLILLDELGAGTDPVEGAALARAIVERLLEKGCLGIATTHYAELKAFAAVTPGVQNASAEFDVETLSPTYKLNIGLPGRSNALAIAARLGLEAPLVARARAMLNQEGPHVEDLLAGLHQERAATALALQRAEELRQDAAKYRDRLANELDELEATRQTRSQALQRELDEELREVRLQLRRLHSDLQQGVISPQALQEAEKGFQTVQKEVRELKQKPKSIPTEASPALALQPPRPLQVKDKVSVASVGLIGEILALDMEDQTANVQVGGFRMQVPLYELRRAKHNPELERLESYRNPRTISLPAIPEVSMTFDMRGWRASEVQERLEAYLNDAFRANLPEIHLVHGKGTGVLRQIVRELLKSHPLIGSFTGGGSAGGEGVTIAKFVER